MGQTFLFIHRVAFRLEPKRHNWLIGKKASLNEPVPERQNPELPLAHNGKELGAIPRAVAQWFLDLGAQTLELPLGFLFGDVEGARRLGEVGDKKASYEGYRQ